MSLFIKVDENKVPQGHPAFENNLKQCFPDHDFKSGPPSGWLEFERIPVPELGVYQKFDDSIGVENSDAFRGHNGLSYELVEGKIKDVWHVREMTDTEKTAKIDAAKERWAKLDPPGPSSWTFNENTCSFEPPVAYPSDGKEYVWDESEKNWKEVTNE